MERFIKENWFKLGILIILLVLAIGYISFLDGKNSLATAKQTQEHLNNAKLDTCLSAVEISTSALWESECKRLNKESNCALPTSLADSIDDGMRKDKDLCFKRYPIR
jgi:hypothetical protein